MIWLGIKALRSRALIAFSSQSHLSHRAVFLTGFLTNVLNPKPALFILAFVPQFVSPMYGAVELQTFLLGTWFALLAFAVFSLLGSFSSLLARWLEGCPRAIVGLNMGAGITFIAAGLSVLLLGRAERS